MRCLIMIGVAAMLVFGWCGPGYALQLIYPQDGTYVTRSDYLIVKGGTDPYLDGLSIEINGVKSDVIDISPAEYRASFGDMLVVEPIFDPGENRIIVEGYLNGEKLDTVRATVFYQDSYDRLPPEGFDQEQFHTAEREAPCADCHNMTPDAEALANPSPRSNACASCHMRMLNKAHVHGPAGVYDCTFCHQPDSQPAKYQPRPGDAALCLECHDDIQAELDRNKFVHGPIEAGMCMICHSPHASDHTAQIVMPVNELCLECHENVKAGRHVVRGPGGQGHPLNGPVNPAEPERKFNCASCHNPHAANAKPLFNFGVTSRMVLCTKCHNK